MILKHKLMCVSDNGNFSYVINRVTSNDMLSNYTKDLFCNELDAISEVISNMRDVNDVLDIRDFDQHIMECIYDRDQYDLLKMIAFGSSDFIQKITPEDVSITESVEIKKADKVNDRVPIFFIFNGGDNILSRTIMMFTRANFSHVSISTSGLDSITSFATTKQNYGMVNENWYDFINIRKPKNIAVHFIDVSIEDYEKIKRTIEFHKAHIREYYYSFTKLFTAPFRTVFKPKDEPQGFICSEFINYLTSGTSIVDSTLDKDSFFITPEAFRKSIYQKSNIVYSGSMDNFNPVLVKNVYELYTKDIISKKNKIDEEIVSSFKKDTSSEMKKQLNKFRLSLNK